MRFLLLASLAFLLPLQGASAATLSVDAPTSANVGSSVTVRVLVNAQGTAINNAEAALSYSADILEPVSISKNGSIFTLWVEEPAFASNSLRFNGGLPTPGYSGTSGTLVSAVFRVKKAGSATISLSNAAVRANDGKGTDVLSGASSARILTQSAPVPVVPKPAPKPTPKPVAEPVAEPQPEITPLRPIMLLKPFAPVPSPVLIPQPIAEAPEEEMPLIKINGIIITITLTVYQVLFAMLLITLLSLGFAIMSWRRPCRCGRTSHQTEADGY